MRYDTRTARYFHSIEPGAAFAGVAEQLRSLSSVVVVRGVNHRTSSGVNPTISFLLRSAKLVLHASAVTIVTTAAAAESILFISFSLPKTVLVSQLVHRRKLYCSDINRLKLSS